MIGRAYVLGGGASRRMGVDKARVAFPGSDPMAGHLAATIRASGLPVWIVRGADDGLPFYGPDEIDTPTLIDGGGERHPLLGVAAALSHAREGLALICPCDTPFLTVATIDRLVGYGAPCVAEDGARRHPLLSVLPAAWAADARALAAAGAPVHRLVDALPGVRVPEADVRNVNAGVVDRVARLVSRVPAGEDRARIVTGEERRLRARGAIRPAGTAPPPTSPAASG